MRIKEFAHATIKGRFLRDIRKSLAKGTAWISGARAITNLLAFIGTLVLARLLAPADFGLVALGTTMLAILMSVTDLSLGSALVQHRDPSEDHFHAAWTLQFLRGVALAIAFFAAAFPAAEIFNEPRLIGLMAVLSLSILIQGCSNPRVFTLQRQLVFWQQFMLQVAAKLTTLVVASTIALLFRSYWALVWGAVAGEAVSLILSYSIVRYRPRFRLRGGRDLLGFSVWLTLGQIVNTLNWKADHLFVGGYIGQTSLGYYTVGDNLAVLPTREATAPITQTLFPAFARLRDQPERLAAAYQQAQPVVTAVALPAGIGTALIAHPLVLLTMGAKWLPAVLVIQVLASVFALQTLGSIARPLGMATGNTRMLFMRDLQGLCIRLPTIIVGMFLAGLTGIIYARALTGSVAIALNMHVVNRITGLGFWAQLRVNLRSLASAAIMALAVSLLDARLPETQRTGELMGHILLLIGVGALTYCGSHLLMWMAGGRPRGPEQELLDLLKRLRDRLGRASKGSEPSSQREIGHS